MKRGIRWYLVVSLWTAAAWPVSSQSVNPLRRRSAIYIQPLPNFSPIPVHFSAQYESSSEGSMWTPSRSGELNVYVPPLRPSPLIVTGRPMKTTFDVPLTKSIRVTQERQTTGHVKKVKVRATTENPGFGMLGSLAESTVQTLLNFTPIDDEWKPKTSGHPIMGPSSYFGKDSGTKVDKHLNYTGIRFGKVNSVTRTMPINGAALKIMKNETNFVMRFTPEDVKYTSLELKTENVLAESPEIQEEQRALFNGQRPSAQLRKENNVPYQGHKTSMNSNSEESGISFNGVQKAKPEFRELDKQLQGHGSLLQDPGITEKMNSDSNKRGPVPYQKDYVLVNEPWIAPKVETGDKNPIRDYRKYFIAPSNTDIDHRKSNPYQGLVTHSPPAPEHDGMNISDRGQNFFGIENYRKNNPLNDALKISVSNNNRSDVPHKVDKYFSSAPPYRYKYPIALSNSYVSNRSQEEDTSTSAEVPSKVGIEYDTAKNTDFVIKNEGNLKFIKQNLEEFRLPQSGPKYQSMVSYEDGSSYKNLKRGFGSNDPFSNTPSFESVTMLKNLTKYSPFNDKDFSKPVLTDSFENETNEEKNLNTFVYSARDRLGEIKNKQRPYGEKEIEKKLPPNVFNQNPSQKSALQLDYIENNNRIKNNISKDADGVYFQPVLPEPVQEIPRGHSQQNKQTSLQWPDKSVSSTLERPSLLPDSSREKTQFINVGTAFSTKAQLLPEDSESGIVTAPPVITIIYDSQESKDNKERNRTENYVIQRKPAILPPRKPKITISTGMLAGILIAALVFLGFLTGSMVYAFHQWKFGRGERPKKKSRNPGFPPEYLDEAFAGNTYIHNNIFLPTPQNPDERNTGDSGSVTGEDEQPSTSRIRRH